MKPRILGVGSWFAEDYPELIGQLRFGTRADRCPGGWVVVPVKRWAR